MAASQNTNQPEPGPSAQAPYKAYGPPVHLTPNAKQSATGSPPTPTDTGSAPPPPTKADTNSIAESFDNDPVADEAAASPTGNHVSDEGTEQKPKTNLLEDTKSFFSNLGIGGILGGLIGLIGAWFAGSIFGSGTMSMVLQAGLSFPAVYWGSKHFGGLIDQMLNPSTKGQQTTSKAPGAQRVTTAPGLEPEPEVASVTVLRNEDVAAMIAQATSKGQPVQLQISGPEHKPSLNVPPSDAQANLPPSVTATLDLSPEFLKTKLQECSPSRTPICDVSLKSLEDGRVVIGSIPRRLAASPSII